MSELPESVRGCEVLAGLSVVELQDVTAMTSVVEVAAEELIFREGDPGDGLYIIASGRVRIAKGPGPVQHELAVLGPGKVFGEMALIDDAPRSADAVATEPSVVYRLDRYGFVELLESENHVAYRVLHEFARMLCRRLRRVTEGE